MAVAEEDGRGLEADVACLSVEKTSLLLELEASKDDVCSSFPGGQGQGSHGGRLLESHIEDFRLWLRILRVQTWHPR